MKNKIKFIFIFFFLFVSNNLYSYEIIRDPVFEEYINNINIELNLDEKDVYLIKNETANAFVIKNNIYFTTGLFDILNYEDTLKAIYLHEYGHVIKNHFHAKKFKIQHNDSRKIFVDLFSLGIAIIAGSADIGIGASISLNSNLVNELSKHSVNFEIEADNFMLNEIKKNKINVSELISFLNRKTDNNYYFRTHPRRIDRINNLRQLKFIKSENSNKFNWIKSKYSKNSENKSFNKFFEDLDKGIYDNEKNINQINKYLTQYEAFKKGLFVENWGINFEKILEINNNSYLKIEYINYILDNNLFNKYEIIENFKFNDNVMNEYFYYYIYGKYYSKINEFNLSNFYFCQFYKAINSKNKSDFFCKKYNNKDIPTLDKSYALFK